MSTRFWRDENNLERFFKWVPVPLEIVAARPDQFIEWRSKDGMTVKSGSASFDPAFGRDGTEVRVAIDGIIPRRLLHEQLRRSKRLIETGEIPTTEGQSAGPGAGATIAGVDATIAGRKGGRMKAICWHGKNNVSVEQVPDPKIIDPRDAIIRVTLSAICGSDIHLYDGYIRLMVDGDILGHEFMGEVVEVGSAITNLRRGDRVVIPFPIACGKCFYCQEGMYSLCENSNPNAALAEELWGYSPAGIFGYSHLLGGYAGGAGAVRASSICRCQSRQNPGWVDG